MEYEKGYVYQLMDQGGPTNVMEPYFLEAAATTTGRTADSPRWSARSG